MAMANAAHVPTELCPVCATAIGFNAICPGCGCATRPAAEVDPLAPASIAVGRPEAGRGRTVTRPGLARPGHDVDTPLHASGPSTRRAHPALIRAALAEATERAASGAPSPGPRPASGSLSRRAAVVGALLPLGGGRHPGDGSSVPAPTVSRHRLALDAADAAVSAIEPPTRSAEGEGAAPHTTPLPPADGPPPTVTVAVEDGGAAPAVAAMTPKPPAAPRSRPSGIRKVDPREVPSLRALAEPARSPRAAAPEVEPDWHPPVWPLALIAGAVVGLILALAVAL